MILKARGVRRLRPIDIRRAKNALLRKSAVLMVAMAMIVVALGMTAMALRAPDARSDVIVEANAPERKVLAAVLGADYSCALMSNGKTECCKNTACGWVSQKNEDDRGACRPQNKIKEDEDMINRCSEPNVDGGLDASTQTPPVKTVTFAADFSAFGGRDKLCNKISKDKLSCEDCIDLSNIIIGAPKEHAHLLSQLADKQWEKSLYGSTLDDKQGKERFLCFSNHDSPSRKEVAPTGIENTYGRVPLEKLLKKRLGWKRKRCEQLGDGIEHCDIPFQTLFDRLDFDHFDKTLAAELITKGLTTDANGNELLHLSIQGVDMTLNQGTPEFTKLKREAADSKYNEQAYLAWPKRALWMSTQSRLNDALLELKLERPKPDTKIHVRWTSGAQAKEDVIAMAHKLFGKLGVGGKIKMLTAEDLDKTEYTKEFWGGSGKVGYDPTKAKYEAWYPNFADKKLFYFGKAWFTGQDETAALEHPLLLGLREWLIDQNTRNCPFRWEAWNEFLPKAPETQVTSKRQPIPNFGQAYCRQFLGKGSMVVRNLPLLFKIERGYPKLNKTSGNFMEKLDKETNEMVIKKVSIYGDEKELLQYCGVTESMKDNKYPVLDFDEWNKKEGDDKFDFLGQGALVGTSQPAKEVDLWAKRTNMYIAAHPVNVGAYYSPEKMANLKNAGNDKNGGDDKRLMMLTRAKTLICNELEVLKDGQLHECKASTCVGLKQIKNFAIKDYKQITEKYLKGDEAFGTTLTLDGNKRRLCYNEPGSERALFYGATGGLHLQYSVKQIQQTFSVILNTFTMIKQSSKNPGNIELHIGNLGAGIFGNNLNTVVLLQLIAAKSVGIERVVYHGGEIGKDKLKNGDPQNDLQGPLKAFIKCYDKDEYTLTEFFDENLIKCITKKEEFEVGTYTSF